MLLFVVLCLVIFSDICAMYDAIYLVMIVFSNIIIYDFLYYILNLFLLMLDM